MLRLAAQLRSTLRTQLIHSKGWPICSLIVFENLDFLGRGAFSIATSIPGSTCARSEEMLPTAHFVCVSATVANCKVIPLITSLR